MEIARLENTGNLEGRRTALQEQIELIVRERAEFAIRFAVITHFFYLISY